MILYVTINTNYLRCKFISFSDSVSLYFPIYRISFNFYLRQRSILPDNIYVFPFFLLYFHICVEKLVSHIIKLELRKVENILGVYPSFKKDTSSLLLSFSSSLFLRDKERSYTNSIYFKGNYFLLHCNN